MTLLVDLLQYYYSFNKFVLSNKVYLIGMIQSRPVFLLSASCRDLKEGSVIRCGCKEYTREEKSRIQNGGLYREDFGTSIGVAN